jgi:hypothetical protein
VNPAECAQEYRTAKRITRLGEQARKKIARPGKEKCTDALVQVLSSTCAGGAGTVDDLISPAGDGGCLIDGHTAQMASLLDAVY